MFQALVWVVARQDRSQQRWIDQPESCSVKSSKVVAIWEGEIVPRVVRGDCFGAFLSMKRVDGFVQCSAAAGVKVECVGKVTAIRVSWDALNADDAARIDCFVIYPMKR